MVVPRVATDEIPASSVPRKRGALVSRVVGIVERPAAAAPRDRAGVADALANVDDEDLEELRTWCAKERARG